MLFIPTTFSLFTAINKCDKFKQACNSNATCENTADAVLCKCKSGYVGPEHGLNCIDDNECNIQSKCDRHAVCSNTIGSYACKCKSGYSGSGKLCTDINECEASNAGSICIKNAQCVNQQGSYKCRCKPGFAGNGTYCFGKFLELFLIQFQVSRHWDHH